MLSFFTTVIYLAGFLFLFSTKESRKALLIRLIIIISLSTINISIIMKGVKLSFLKGYVDNVKSVFWLKANYENNTQNRKYLLVPLKVSSEINNSIGKSSIEILPYNLISAQANNWNYKLNPIFQLYSVYTKNLDKISAEHFHQKDAPEFILLEFLGIDGRNMLIDNPQTWNTVFLNYKYFAKDNKRLFLKRKDKITHPKFQHISSHNYKFDEKIYIPEFDKNVYAQITIRHSFLGRLYTFLFRNTETVIIIGYDNGIVRTYRVITDTLNSPLQIGYIPTKFDEMAYLITKKYDNLSKVKYIKFKTDKKYYRNDIKVKWMVQDESKLSF